ncbi:MAG: alpha/beta hydrolase, partial [bacterium]
MKKIAFLVILISICTSTFAYTYYADIEYYPSGTAPQLDKNMLDIYIPDGASATTPVIFFVHGGTWMFNDRTDFAAVGTELADGEDYVVVIPSYRLSDSLHPENTHPCHIE